MNQKKKIKLALIDDHVLFREGLKDLLLDQPDLDIVGEGGDGDDALGIVSEKELDVLLIDLRLPRLGGISTIRRLRETYKELKIIVISMYEDEDHQREAILAGADAYHSKMDGPKEIIATIHKLVQGKKVIKEETLRAYRRSSSSFSMGYDTSVTLTATEHGILESLALGLHNKDLADHHCISERTLKNHLNTIFKKLGVKTRLEAVRRGVEKGLISLSV